MKFGVGRYSNFCECFSVIARHDASYFLIRNGNVRISLRSGGIPTIWCEIWNLPKFRVGRYFLWMFWCNPETWRRIFAESEREFTNKFPFRRNIADPRWNSKSRQSLGSNTTCSLVIGSSSDNLWRNFVCFSEIWGLAKFSIFSEDVGIAHYLGCCLTEGLPWA